MKEKYVTTEKRLLEGVLNVLRGHGIEIEMTPQLDSDLRFELTRVLHT